MMLSATIITVLAVPIFCLLLKKWQSSKVNLVADEIKSIGDGISVWDSRSDNYSPVPIYDLNLLVSVNAPSPYGKGITDSGQSSLSRIFTVVSLPPCPR